MVNQQCDILIVGAGTGGTAAALALRECGFSVVLTEETAWLGGQLTSQGVPPDEHPWIEQFGGTLLYRQYRNAVRNAYVLGQISPEAKTARYLNPGGGWVSQLCHEPKVSARILDFWSRASNLTVIRHVRPIEAATDGDLVKSVTFRSLETGQTFAIEAKLVLDATELGDVLHHAGAEYVTGFESRLDTGEPSAPEEAQPNNWQAITWVFAMAHDAGSNRTISKPDDYDAWRTYQPPFWPGPLLGFQDVNPWTLQPRHLPLYREDGGLALFDYRQIVSPEILGQPDRHPVTIVNWPMNDYFVRPIIDKNGERDESAMVGAMALSRSLLYWLQTEAPRHDGGIGYPGLYMYGESVGTEDGFAMFPYIREARRALTVKRICEQDVSATLNPGLRVAPLHEDSVGVGAYRIDLHPSTGGDNYLDVSSLPFQIPLGALVPVRMRNLIPCAKNIGTTHITNGCYRLHPVEWNIGESAGHLAAYCLTHGLSVQAVWESPAHVSELQRMLDNAGIERRWPEVGPL